MRALIYYCIDYLSSYGGSGVPEPAIYPGAFDALVGATVARIWHAFVNSANLDLKIYSVSSRPQIGPHAW